MSDKNTDSDPRQGDWVDSVFTDDYAHFLESQLCDAQNDAEVEVITRVAELAPGMQVLDAPCGWGRIGNRLARGGASVIGIDLNAAYVSAAIAEAEAWGVDARYGVGDIRRLDADGEFDAVVNWYTSFGYFDDATNRDVLSRFARALRPGGVLLIENLNRDWLVRRIGKARRLTYVTERGDDLMVDRVSFDPATGFSQVERVMVRDGVVTRGRLRLQRLGKTELEERLFAAGFDDVRFLDSRGGEMSIVDPRFITLARLPT